MRARGTVLSLMILLLVASCSSKPKTKAQPGAHEASGPIHALAVGASLGQKGVVEGPTYTFGSKAKQIVVVALVRSNTTVDFTWSRLPDFSQPQTLFTHSVKAAAHTRAFSIGTNPGTLAEGSYSVQVGTPEQTSTVVFDVTGSTSNAAAAPPASGASGTAPETSASGNGNEERVDVTWWGLDQGPPIPFSVQATVQTADGISVHYGVVGAPALALNFIQPAGAEERHDLLVDPCTFPNGSDLPGTRVRVEAALTRAGKVAPGSTATDEGSLGPDTLAPRVKGDTTPKAGSKVKKGDKITINLFGEETRDGASWQTGVQNVQIMADGVLIDTAEAQSKLPKKCDQKQWKLTFDHKVEYEVPQNAKPSFEICALVQDFAGNTKKVCGTYYTAEVWKGPVSGQTRQPGCSPATTKVTGSLQVNVGDNGAITGSDTEARGSYSCGGVTAPAYSKTFNNLSGTKTETAFNLVISGKKLTIPISGNSATATVVQNGRGGYGATTTYTLTCQDCA